MIYIIKLRAVSHMFTRGRSRRFCATRQKFRLSPAGFPCTGKFLYPSYFRTDTIIVQGESAGHANGMHNTPARKRRKRPASRDFQKASIHRYLHISPDTVVPVEQISSYRYLHISPDTVVLVESVKNPLHRGMISSELINSLHRDKQTE